MNDRNRVQKGVSTGGQFAQEARSEAAGVTLTGGNTPPVDRAPDQLLESPLTAYEVGRRIDNDYRIDGVVPVWMSEVQQGEQESDEHIAGLLAEGGDDHLDDVSYEPVGIHEDGRILMMVSANAQNLVDDGFSDEKLQQLEAGVNAGKVRSASSYGASHFHDMSDLAGASPHVMEDVPPLPEGFSEDSVHIGEDDSGRTMVGIDLDNGEELYVWAENNAMDEIELLANTDDLTAGTGLDSETENQLLDHLKSVANNVANIERTAMSRLRANKSFKDRVRKLAYEGRG